MDLTASTYLGDNTVPVLDDIVASLGAAGFDIRVDPGAGRDSRDARRHAAGVDLVWMCGSLASVMLGAGDLDHHVVAAPVFPGETAAVYRSVFVVRDDGGPATLDEALGGTVGINEPESWSGNHGLRRFLGGSWFAAETPTGSHAASLDAVRRGDCDVAGIDSSIWDASELAGLRVVATTGDWPAPPLLVRRGAPADLARRLIELRPDGLERIEPASPAIYEPMRP